MTNEELNKIMAKADDDLDRLKDRCHELYEENEKLKELCNKYEEEHNTTYQEWQKDIQANKKAIEWIENYTIQLGTFGGKEATKRSIVLSDDDVISNLLNILQGE